MTVRIYLLVVEVTPDDVAAPVTVDTSGESIPESRPAMERPGLRKCRAEQRIQRGKVAVL